MKRVVWSTGCGVWGEVTRRQAQLEPERERDWGAKKKKYKKINTPQPVDCPGSLDVSLGTKSVRVLWLLWPCTWIPRTRRVHGTRAVLRAL
jgi:hypothetical protein